MDRPFDELIDLSQVFKKKQAAVYWKSQEYLDSFLKMAVYWDSRQMSDNLEVTDPLYDARIIKCKKSF